MRVAVRMNSPMVRIDTQAPAVNLVTPAVMKTMADMSAPVPLKYLLRRQWGSSRWLAWRAKPSSPATGTNRPKRVGTILAGYLPRFGSTGRALRHVSGAPHTRLHSRPTPRRTSISPGSSLGKTASGLGAPADVASAFSASPSPGLPAGAGSGVRSRWARATTKFVPASVSTALKMVGVRQDAGSGGTESPCKTSCAP
jgi:hypothetical protein